MHLLYEFRHGKTKEEKENQYKNTQGEQLTDDANIIQDGGLFDSCHNREVHEPDHDRTADHRWQVIPALKVWGEKNSSTSPSATQHSRHWHNN